MTFAALLGSEVRRLGSRRVVWWGTAGALALVVLVVVLNTINSTGTGVGEHTMRLSKLWLEHPGGVAENTLLAMSVFVFIIVVGIAATAVGGDYRAGTFGTLLLWEPRRVRVAVARLVALTIVTVVVYLVVTGVLVGGWYAGSALRGSTSGLGPDFWTDLAAVVGRCTVGAVVLTLITAGLAFITRSTVGALMVWIGYLIAVEGILAARVRSLDASLLLRNLSAFLTGYRLEITGPQTVGPTGRFTGERYLVLPGPALLRMVVIALIVAGLGVGLFWRRDVT